VFRQAKLCIPDIDSVARPTAVAVDLRAKPRAKRFFMQRLMKALSAKRPRYHAGIANQTGFLMLRICLGA